MATSVSTTRTLNILNMLIKKNDDVIFFTDLADTGSAPYNTVLTWSYVNA